MRQVMPHRNNMCLHRSKCKIFLRDCLLIVGSATILQQPRRRRFLAVAENDIKNNGLHRRQFAAAAAPQRKRNG